MQYIVDGKQVTPIFTMTRGEPRQHVGDRYLTPAAHLGYLDENGVPKNFGSHYSDESVYSMFVVKAQTDPQCATGNPANPFYAVRWGFSTEFTGEVLDSKRLAKMAAIARGIDRKLERYERDWGYDQSFDATVLRVARALGVKQFATLPRGTHTYDQASLWQINEIKGWVNRLVADFIKGA